MARPVARRRGEQRVEPLRFDEVLAEPKPHHCSSWSSQPRSISNTAHRIEGDELDFDAISLDLDLKPTRILRKGEKWSPPKPSSVHDAVVDAARGHGHKHDAWIYVAPVSEERPPHEHIDALWGALRRSATYLRSLKETATVKVWLSSETKLHPSFPEGADITLPPRSLEIFNALEVPLRVGFEVG